ncbi:MAG: hypothetical protein LBG11_07725 [Bifidobacteriaceae bacterium]|nr:hypothetical protein [Bifidobacteriaceae bacterium]
MADLARLNVASPALAEAALRTVADVANRRKRGKALGERNVSGDLTGVFRLEFDLDGRKPERYRLLYSLSASGGFRVLALGERHQHRVYRAATERVR